MPSQLPIRIDVETLGGIAVVPVNLGFNASGYTFAATLSRAWATSSGGATSTSTSLSCSVVSAADGQLSITFPAGLSTHPSGALDYLLQSASWTLTSSRTSAEDPATARRTHAVGAVSVGAGIDESSPRYMEIVMVRGDEFTFTVALGESLSGYSSVLAVANSGSLIASVLDSSAGSVKVTVPESASGAANENTIWQLYGTSPSGNTIFRQGPLIVTDGSVQSGTAEAAAAVSLFL